MFGHHIFHRSPSLISHPSHDEPSVHPLPARATSSLPHHVGSQGRQVAKPVSQSTVATRQYHRHQLPHSRGAAWQPHGNHMVQSGYTTTGTREGQEKCVSVFVCVCAPVRRATMFKLSKPEPGSHCVFLISVSCLFSGDFQFKRKIYLHISVENHWFLLSTQS